MKRLLVLAAAALACGSLAVAAYSAAPKKDDKPPAPSKAQIDKGMKLAPDAIAAAGLKCTLKNAADIGATEVEGADKKKVKAELIEIACGEGLGYVLRHPESGKTDAYNCLQIEASYIANKNKGARCALPENADPVAQIQPMFDRTGAKCKVTDAAAVGSTPTFMRFEVACSEGSGYQFDVMNSGETRPGAMTCLEADASNNPCKLTTKAQAVSGIMPLAMAADKTCKVSDARYIGTTQSHHIYYEIGCTGKPGFIVESDEHGGFVQTFDCLHAQNAGGCKFTDVGAAKAAAGADFVAALKAHNVACTVGDFRDVGPLGDHRELVEFACPEQAWGLVALVPPAGSSAKFEQMDCISAKERAYDCGLTTKATILGLLKPILAAVGKTCDPTDYKVLGPGDLGDSVEVKCSAGQSGYVVDLPVGRAKTAKTVTCAQAKGGVNECTIPGNS